MEKVQKQAQLLSRGNDIKLFYTNSFNRLRGFPGKKSQLFTVTPFLAHLPSDKSTTELFPAHIFISEVCTQSSVILLYISSHFIRYLHINHILREPVLIQSDLQHLALTSMFLLFLFLLPHRLVPKKYPFAAWN